MEPPRTADGLDELLRKSAATRVQAARRGQQGRRAAKTRQRAGPTEGAATQEQRAATRVQEQRAATRVQAARRGQQGRRIFKERQAAAARDQKPTRDPKPPLQQPQVIRRAMTERQIAPKVEGETTTAAAARRVIDAERLAASAEKRAEVFQREIKMLKKHVLGLHERLMQAEQQVRSEVANGDSVQTRVQGEMSVKTAQDHAHAESIRAAKEKTRADAAESFARDLAKRLATSDETVKHLRSSLRRYEDNPAFGKGNAPRPSPTGPKAIRGAYGAPSDSRRLQATAWEVPKKEPARKEDSEQQPQPQQQPKSASTSTGPGGYCSTSTTRLFHEMRHQGELPAYGRGTNSGLMKSTGRHGTDSGKASYRPYLSHK